MTSKMQTVEVHGSHTKYHAGVTEFWHPFCIEMLAEIYALEGQHLADEPNTSDVMSGDFHKKVDNHGYSRRFWITAVHCDGASIDVRTHGKRHWRLNAVVSYDGISMHLPEGGNWGHVTVPQTVQVNDLMAVIQAKI